MTNGILQINAEGYEWIPGYQNGVRTNKTRFSSGQKVWVSEGFSGICVRENRTSDKYEVWFRRPPQVLSVAVAAGDFTVVEAFRVGTDRHPNWYTDLNLDEVLDHQLRPSTVISLSRNGKVRFWDFLTFKAQHPLFEFEKHQVEPAQREYMIKVVRTTHEVVKVLAESEDAALGLSRAYAFARDRDWQSSVVEPPREVKVEVSLVKG
jgi:hypothetical protein